MDDDMGCCGFPCLTRFCPHCGKQLRNKHDLTTLLAYIANHLDKAKKLCHATEGERLRKCRAATLAKWESWYDQLDRHLKGEAKT